MSSCRVINWGIPVLAPPNGPRFSRVDPHAKSSRLGTGSLWGHVGWNRKLDRSRSGAPRTIRFRPADVAARAKPSSVVVDGGIEQVGHSLGVRGNCLLIVSSDADAEVTLCRERTVPFLQRTRLIRARDVQDNTLGGTCLAPLSFVLRVE